MKTLTVIFINLILSITALGQSCTVNAGIDYNLCSDVTTITLLGNAGGAFDNASNIWTQSAGPNVSIISPNSLTTAINGLTPGNTYQFVLSLVCTDLNTVSDTVLVTVEDLPQFTAGIDTVMCNNSNLTLNATLPLGYTGSWSSSSLDVQFSNPIDTNATISIAQNCFSSAILTWTISNGVCSYSDQILLTGVGDPALILPNQNNLTICANSTYTILPCMSYAYGTVIVTPINEPSPATIIISNYGNNSTIVQLNNFTAIGTYSYTISGSSNLCSGSFSTTFTVTVDALGTPNSSWYTNVTSTPEEQSGNYAGSGSMKRTFHCVDQFNLEYDTIWLYSNPATPAGGTTEWSITTPSYAIDDPTADTTFAVYTGIPISAGFQYIDRKVTTANQVCQSNRFHQLILYNNPPPVFTPDTVVCNSDPLIIGANEGLSPVYHQFSAAMPYFLTQNYAELTQIGGQPLTVTTFASNNGIQSDDYLEFSGMSQGNIYTFVYSISPSVNWITFPYHSCYEGPLSDTFTITFPNPPGSSSGTSMNLGCTNSTSFAGATGAGQNGMWSFVSGPSIPTIIDPYDNNTTITNMNSSGTYLYNWVVNDGCATTIDSIEVNINCALLPVELADFNLDCSGQKNLLTWKTLSEYNNDYFTIQKTCDGINFNSIGTIAGAGNSGNTIEYEFTDTGTSNCTGHPVYYRLVQTDFDGKEQYQPLISGDCEKKKTPSISITDKFIAIRSELSFSTEVSSITGLLLIQENSHKESNQYVLNINRDDLDNGSYQIQIITSNGALHIKRILIQDAVFGLYR